MRRDFVLRACWPQGLVLDPIGSGSGGSGSLYWEGWLPHSHIGAIAKGLNCIFKTGIVLEEVQKFGALFQVIPAVAAVTPGGHAKATGVYVVGGHDCANQPRVGQEAVGEVLLQTAADRP